MMEYKGYIGKAEVDPRADLITGEIVGIRDVITFQGRTPSELFQAFKDSVDDYLEFCKSRGEQPDKPFSGKFIVRTDPELHRRMSVMAECEGQSLNSWINQRLVHGGTTLDVVTPRAAGKTLSKKSIEPRRPKAKTLHRRVNSR